MDEILRDVIDRIITHIPKTDKWSGLISTLKNQPPEVSWTKIAVILGNYLCDDQDRWCIDVRSSFNRGADRAVARDAEARKNVFFSKKE